MDTFLHIDATAQAELVRSGAVTPLELVDAAIARIEALDGQLNAVTIRLFDRARKAASGPLPGGPFRGVPFLIKDLSAVSGATLSYGCRMFAGNRAVHNEAITARALQAGFIILGKTNTAEFGLLPTTEPLLWGPTHNPWNLAYSAGGSSGGSAAAVASGMVSIAQGGDGGGSIRIPASCCGLFGLKPSRGRTVPTMRKTPGDTAVNLCLSRSVRDTARFLEISEQRGKAAVFPPLGFVAGPSPRRLRIAWSSANLLGQEPEPEVRAALDDAVKLCASLGHTVEEAAPRVDGEEGIRNFLAFWAHGPSLLVRNFWMLRLKTLSTKPITALLEPWTLGLADWFDTEERRNPGMLARATAFFRNAGAEMDTFFSRYDVHLTPVLRRLPAKLGEFAPTVPFATLLDRCIGHITYTPLHNAVGTPAMSVPLSMSADGLPIGTHFAARKGDERTLLELAYELEQAQPWAGRWPPVARRH